jgi:hypothetical protein
MTKTATGLGAITASAPSTEHGVGRGVLAAPAAWYSHPEPDGYTRLTVTDDGQVYGHIAPWGAAHRATGVSSDKVRGDDFSEFHTGRVTTAEGDDLDIGHLTIGGGHAPLDVTPQAALEHYDNVATAWAHVRASEGQHGIWVAGSVAPGATDLMVHKAKAFPPSGDWRQFVRGGPYRMIACCQVVTPGFPVHELKAQIAAAGQALVASAADWSGVTAAGDFPELGGPPFRVLIFPEGDYNDPAFVSRDGRSIDVGATVWGDGPWTLWHKLRDEHGSMETEGTVMVGRIDRIERDAKNEVWGYGNFDTSEEATAAATLVEKGMLRGISGDLGEMRGTYLGAEIEIWVEPEDSDGDPNTPETITIPDEPFDSAEPWMTVQYAELLGATLCGKPAYRDAQIFLDGPVEQVAMDDPIAASMLASAAVRQRVQPFTVVGRPRAPRSEPIESQVQQLQTLVARQAEQIASLSGRFVPGAKAHLAKINETRRTKALARIDRARR